MRAIDVRIGRERLDDLVGKCRVGERELVGDCGEDPMNITAAMSMERFRA